MNRFITFALAWLLLSAPAFAGTGTITVLDSTSTTKTYAVITNGATNFISQMGVCDGTAAAQCAAVKAASTAPIATDPALVVALSPNSAGISVPGQAVMAASQPVAIASDQSAYPIKLQDGAGNAIGSSGSGTPLSTTNVPLTSGGLSVYFVQPGASDNHVNIKNGVGQVYKIDVTNNSATPNYLRLYNAGTGFNGCGSATNLVYQMAIPALTSIGGISSSWDLGMAFSTGISICVSSGYATTDTTAATASAMSVNIGYK